MERKLRGIDFPLLLMYLFLVGFGILNIYSVSENSGVKQFQWFGISLVVGVLIFFIRATFFETFAGVFYVVGVLLLILLFPLGSEVNGAKAWFKFGSISLQPVEFVKIGTALMLANFVNSPGFNFKNTISKAKAFATLLFPIILILLQPDVGSIMVFTAFFIALFREGLSGFLFIIGAYFATLFLTSIYSSIFNTHSEFLFLTLLFLCLILFYIKSYFNNTLIFSFLILILVITFLVIIMIYQISNESKMIFFIVSLVLLFIAVIFREKSKKSFFIVFGLVSVVSISVMILSPIIMKKLPNHHRERIEVLFRGEGAFKDTAGYNLLYAKTAIGSGGFYGKGFNKGTVTDGGFVPEQRTDYIFCTVGEEWGFWGSSLLLIIYACFILRIYYVSEKQKSSFVRVFGYCISSIFFMHFIMNVGMVIGLFPTVGVPLPYFSYGGSSLLAFSIMFFIFLRLIYFDNREVI